jgi:quinoprotein dehydrogenase-associated probable ABC transporter substrate-binding protein
VKLRGVAVVAAVLCTTAAAPADWAARDRVLRVCADPNNLPFSNKAGEGFENALAELVAKDLGRTVAYTWHAQRRGFIRETLAAGECDAVMGVPAGFETAATTRPYYRSTYVFITKRARALKITSFDDARLKTLTIGVHIIGDDYAMLPPAQALNTRGIVRNVRGFSIYGDYGKPNPPADLIEAVSDGRIDVAIAWGPLAGYFAARSRTPLALTPVPDGAAGPNVPLAYGIAMGVRRNDRALKQQLDEFIVRRRAAIDAILQRFHVPRA